MRFRSFRSRLGEVLIAAENEKLRWLFFTSGRTALRPDPDWVEDERDPLLGETKRQITSYFARRLERFELPLDPQGTPFQERVWNKLLAIPYGTTVAYSELARQTFETVRRSGPWARPTARTPSPSSPPAID